MSEPGPDVAPGPDAGAIDADVEELTEAILRERPTLTADDLAESAGIDLEQGRRLWRALGFAESAGTRAYTSADATAVRRLMLSVDSGLLDFDLAIGITRALGQTMARLADWEVGAIASRIKELEPGVTRGGRVSEGLRIVEELGEDFEQLLLYVWRRHLAAAVIRIESQTAHEDDLHTTIQSVGFADIVSFTALSNDLPRDRIGDLVELFESRCSDVVTSTGGRVIKTIGDAVLYVNDDPVAAFETAEGIISVIGRDQRMPDVRVGLATGPVVLRLGDVFGPPVNLAARLTNVARRNRIIIDAATADLLPREDFDTRRLPARPLRGFGNVEPVAVSRL